MTLEELIRDRAAKGELVHLSVVHSALGWHAVYAPAHTFGIENGTGKDPVDAMIAALTSVKSSRKKVTAKVTKEVGRMEDVVGEPPKPDKLDDWMTKV